MYKMPYILEVQRYDPTGHIDHPEWNGKCEHIGYMKKIFTTKKKSCEYYDNHNPHMRGINAHNTYRSDWDPTTYLLYIVRDLGLEYRKIENFI